MTDMIVVWRDTPGQQVSTVADAENRPLVRDVAYVEQNQLQVLTKPEELIDALARADGVKFAVPVDTVRAALGWDI